MLPLAVPDIIINARYAIPGDELRMAFSRSGGPGGQNVNKVASKVELRWTPATSRAFSDVDRHYLMSRLASRLTNTGELLVVSTLTRDQIQNRGDAEDKLAAIIRDALIRPKVRRPTKPTRGSKERRIGAKKQRAAVKQGRSGRHED